MTFTVKGMTCGHCVAAVSEEVGKIANVRDVHVDLANGTVTVLADAPVTATEFVVAVSEAGYEVAAGA